MYWTHVAAEKVLYEEGLEWRTGVDVVAYARCFGEGRFIRGKHRVKFFKRFRCYIQPVAAEDYVFGNDPYWITFQVIGPRDWDYEMRDPGP